MLYENNTDADQPAHLHSLISVFVVRCLDSIIPMSRISRLQLATEAEQVGLSHTCSETSEDRFSHDVAQITERH